MPKVMRYVPSPVSYSPVEYEFDSTSGEKTTGEMMSHAILIVCP